MANFTEFCDDGFQGHVNTHQKEKLREYFCINPWPDSELVSAIAVEIGVPEFIVDDYFNWFRTSHSDGSGSSNIKTNSADTIQSYKEGKDLDGTDKILDDLYDSPVEVNGFSFVDVKVSDENDGLSSTQTASVKQDELMVVLSEVGLSTGQMTNFCSESYIFEAPNNASRDASHHQSTENVNPSHLYKRDVPFSGLNFRQTDLNFNVTNSKHEQQKKFSPKTILPKGKLVNGVNGPTVSSPCALTRGRETKHSPLNLTHDPMPKKRNTRCRTCSPCRAADCGICMYCLDKPKFGGPNRRKNACIHRKCINMVPSRRNSSKSITHKKGDRIHHSMLKQATHDVAFKIEGHGKIIPEEGKSPIFTRSESLDDLHLKKLQVEAKELVDDSDYLINGSIKTIKSVNLGAEYNNNEVTSSKYENCESTPTDLDTVTSIGWRSETPFSGVQNNTQSQYLTAMDVSMDRLESPGFLFDKPGNIIKKGKEGEFPQKQKLFAVNLDHGGYAINTLIFDEMGEVGGEEYGQEFDKESNESVDIEDFYDENCNDKYKEMELGEFGGDLINYVNYVDDEYEIEVLYDGIVHPETEDLRPSTKSSCDEFAGPTQYTANIVSGGKMDEIPTTALEDIDTVDASTGKYFPKMNTLGTLEDEKQLLADFDFEEPMNDSRDEAKDTCPTSVVVDTNNYLIFECSEDIVVKDSNTGNEGLDFSSKPCENSSDCPKGQSSPCPNSLSASKTQQLLPLESLVSKSGDLKSRDRAYEAVLKVR